MPLPVSGCDIVEDWDGEGRRCEEERGRAASQTQLRVSGKKDEEKGVSTMQKPIEAVQV